MRIAFTPIGDTLPDHLRHIGDNITSMEATLVGVVVYYTSPRRGLPTETLITREEAQLIRDDRKARSLPVVECWSR